MVSMTMEAIMWTGEGPVLSRDNPIQYRVDGLPAGHEALIGLDAAAPNPARWKITTREDKGAWARFGSDSYTSAADALAALRSEFSS